MEDQFIPQTVVSDDAAAKLCLFPLGGEVQQPSLQFGVCLSKNLMSQEIRFYYLWSHRRHLAEPDSSLSPRPKATLCSVASLPFGTYSVKHPVQQSGDHRKDSGLKCLEVIHKQPDISLEKSYFSSMTQHYTLEWSTETTNI